ncbi:MAG: hypothetical protein E7316_07195 [Clostridiales bacterium]|nr:hypothetical protein [Clostridiales bacterium]
MKLFDTFEAVKFPEEDMIFITCGGYLYYIYNPEYKWWRKHSNAGNDHLTVSNYPDVSREELVDAMKGLFPQKETDFMRLCNSSQLCIRDMLALLKEDYAKYMSDRVLYHTIHHFLLESDICHKSFEKLQKLLDDATANQYDNNQVLTQIKNLSFMIIGRDIFKKEIGIVDGHDSSSYFWIMPVRVIEYENTADLDSVAEMRSAEISIEEDDVAQYLTPFLYQHFDEELEENKKRKDVSGFEWYLEHNFFTFDSMVLILKDIEDTVDALISGRETEYTQKLKIKRGTATYQLVYAKNLNEEEIAEYNANRPTEDDTQVALIVDFYQRFLYRMEYMMKVGKEKGCNLISFMGP